jgi:hypothetical protein
MACMVDCRLLVMGCMDCMGLAMDDIEFIVATMDCIGLVIDCSVLAKDCIG